jgi:hypothetical protein
MSDGWDRARRRITPPSNPIDRGRLATLLDDYWGELTEWEQEAYTDMLEWLKDDTHTLSDIQHGCIDRTEDRVGVVVEYENLVSSGRAPLGKPVELLVKDRPLKPPTKRRDPHE